MTLTKIVPNLMVTDMTRAITFYRDVLGFALVRSVPDQAPYAFAWMQRGPIDIFLNDAASVRKELEPLGDFAAGAGGITLYFVVEGIDVLHRTVEAKVTIALPLERKFYGMTEFTIQDADGYVLTFAERQA